MFQFLDTEIDLLNGVGDGRLLVRLLLVLLLGLLVLASRFRRPALLSRWSSLKLPALLGLWPLFRLLALFHGFLALVRLPVLLGMLHGRLGGFFGNGTRCRGFACGR